MVTLQKSMSQTGAGPGGPGLSHQEILGKFYPGTQLRLLRRNDGQFLGLAAAE